MPIQRPIHHTLNTARGEIESLRFFLLLVEKWDNSSSSLQTEKQNNLTKTNILCVLYIFLIAEKRNDNNTFKEKEKEISKENVS